VAEDHPSDWRTAVVDALCCKKCGAANRPGVRYVDLEPNGQAVCRVCAHAFTAVVQIA
jgi:hypothetical protein